MTEVSSPAGRAHFQCRGSLYWPGPRGSQSFPSILRRSGVRRQGSRQSFLHLALQHWTLGGPTTAAEAVVDVECWAALRWTRFTRYGLSIIIWWIKISICVVRPRVCTLRYGGRGIGAVREMVRSKAGHGWRWKTPWDQVIKGQQLIGPCLLPPPGPSVAEPYLLELRHWWCMWVCATTYSCCWKTIRCIHMNTMKQCNYLYGA